MTTRGRAALVLLGALAWWPAGAGAFTTVDPSNPVWPGASVTYHVNRASFAAAGLGTAGVVAGADEWNTDPVATIVSTRGSDSARNPPGSDGLNDVYFELADFPLGSNVLAVTSFRFDAASHAMREADVSFNGVNFAWADPLPASCSEVYDIRSTMTHEWGHALGLGHSSQSLATCDPRSQAYDAVQCEATMYFAGGPCDASGATLACDDRAGIRFLYAPGGSPRADWAPSAFVADPPPGSVALGQGVLVRGTATNVGAVATATGLSGLHLEVAPDAPLGAHRVESQALGSTDPCRTRSVSLGYTFTAADVGTRYLIVRLDDSNTSAELNENDNVVVLGPYTVGSGPTLVVAPSMLTFDAGVGAPPPAGQSVSVTNGGAGTFTWSATADRPWITVAPTGGAPGASFTVTVDPSGLPVGANHGTVTVSAAGAASSPQQVPVTLQVTQAPVLSVTPVLLSFAGQVGGPLPASQPLSISNAGGGSLAWSATADVPWLSASPGSGMGAGQVTVAVTSTSLAAGHHVGHVTVDAGGAVGSPIVVDVALDLTSNAPSLAVSPSSLTFLADLGGPSPPAQSLAVTNAGTGALSFSVSSDRPWLAATPGSGSAPASVSVRADPTGLAAGSYAGTVTITAAGATGSPASVGVTLSVRSGPSIDVAPTTLAFAARRDGANPASRGFAVRNDGAGSLSYTVSEDATWLNVSPAGGSLVAGASRNHSCSVSIAGLVVGSYSTHVMVSDPRADDSPRSVLVTLEVTQAPPLVLSPTSLDFVASAAAPVPQPKAVALSTSGAADGAWTVVSDRSWLAVTPTSGTGDAALTVSVDVSALPFGLSSGSLTIAAPGLAGSPQGVPVTVTVEPGPRLAVSPVTSAWSADRGGPLPESVAFSVSNEGVGSLAWTISGVPTWLQVAPLSGSAPGGFAARPNTTALPPGRYVATFQVGSPSSYGSPRLVDVAYDVVGPSLVLAPERLAFEIVAGAVAGSGSATVHVGDSSGEGSLAWSVRTTTPWLSVAPANGTSGDDVVISLRQSDRLPVGLHDGAVVFTAAGAGNSPAPLPVTLHVRPHDAPVLYPDRIVVHARVGDDLVPVSPVAVDEAGDGAGPWTVTAMPSWLVSSTDHGGPGSQLALHADVVGLAAGTYSDVLRVASDSGAAQASIDLVVHDAPAFLAAPSAVALLAAVGERSESALVHVATVGTDAPWSAQANAPWLRLSAGVGGDSSLLGIAADAASLPVGSYVGTVTVGATGGVPTPVGVTLSVVPSAAPLAAFSLDALAGCAPLDVVVDNLTSGETTSFEWSLDDGSTSTAFEPRFLLSTPGRNHVRLTARGPGGASSVAREIVVRQPPLVDAGRDRRLAFEADGETSVALVGARVAAAAPARIASLTWTTSAGSFVDTGAATSHLERPTLVVSVVHGGLTVLLHVEASDDAGCSASDDARLVFSEDGDADGDTWGELVDNCPGSSNFTQADSDGDGVGDRCDDCPTAFDPLQSDVDANHVGDACDSALVRTAELSSLHARACDGAGMLRVASASRLRLRRLALQVHGPVMPETAAALEAASAVGGVAVLGQGDGPGRIELRAPAGVLTGGDLLEMTVPIADGASDLAFDCGDLRLGLAGAELAGDCASGLISLHPDGDLAPAAARDGRVDVGDVVRILRASVGLDALSPDDLARADLAPGIETAGTWVASPDCAVNVADVVVALRASVHLITLAR